ncbi:MAG: metallophosphoesterase [bacterium]
MISFPPLKLRYQKGHPFHNLLVLLGRSEDIHPYAILAGAFAALAAVGLIWPVHGELAVMVSVAALGIEASIIARTWFTYSSPSPFNGPFTSFALGHLAAAAVPPLLPIAPAAMLGLHLFFQAGLFAAMLWASTIEPFRVTLRKEEIELESATGECRVLVISDLHLDRRGRREEKTLELARDFKPHIIAMPGDLTNLSFVGDPETFRQTREFVSELCSMARVYVSLGTPEVDPRWWIGSILHGTPAELLHNRAVETNVNGTGLYIMGVTFQGEENDQVEHLARLAAANPGRPALLLFHSPDLAEVAPRFGVDLYIAGHTHGGQVRFPPAGALYTASRFGNKYAHGKFHLNGTALVVSRGIGLEGAGAPRLRFFCPPEVVGVTIRPAHQSLRQ